MKPEAPIAQVLDLAHLDRQTMGDAGLRAEILALAQGEFDELLSQLDAIAVSERAGLAHRLKGAARAIGAFALGDAAQALEAAPQDPASMLRLAERVTELRPALLRAMGRGG
ncbi:MAG: Hpt domain-containing protein [Rhizobiaceae bacterium]|nr:Hpt domain-containing protein [Rhizobiaceae bacterium]